MSYSVFSPVRKLAFVTAASVVLWGCQSTPGPEAASTIDTAPVSGFLWTAATTSQDANNYAAAVGYYQSLYTRDPSDIEAALGLARNLRYTGSAEQALDILRSAMLEHPDNPELKAEVGKAQLAIGDVDEAVATLREVTKESPEDWQAVSALGIAYDQLEDYEKAQAQYRMALEISPKNISILNNLALSMALSGDLAGGLEILRQVTDRRKSRTQVRQNLALLYAMNGDMETAERLIKQDLPVQMAEHNIEFYRRVYPGVASDLGAATSKEVSPARQMASGDVTRDVTGDVTGDDMLDGAVERVAPARVAGGVADVDAAAEPMLRADTDPAHPGVEAVALSAGAPDSDTLAAPADAMVGLEGGDDAPAAAYAIAETPPDADAVRAPMLYEDAGVADSGGDVAATYAGTGPRIAVAARPDIDAEAALVNGAFAGYGAREDALAPVFADAELPVADVDADASRVPMLVAETDSDADETYVVTARQQAVAEWPDIDTATVPLSVDFAGYDVRDDTPAALPAEAEVAPVADIDAGRAPMLYVDADTADSGSEIRVTPAKPEARDHDDDVIGVAGSSDVMSLALSESEPPEFDIGAYDEATISGGANPVPGTVDARPRAALVMANPAATDAPPTESTEAATPEEMAETMLGTPSAPSLAEGGSNAPPAAHLDSVLAGFADSMAAPAETASADTQERGAVSFGYAGNQAANAPGPIDRALAGFAAQRQASRATHETPAETEETVVAARSLVPPPPTVDSGKALAAAPVSDDVMIELGAFPSLGDATRWLVRLRASHGALLSGVRFQIKGTDDSRAGTRYRLIAGPVESEAVAADFCNRLEGFREDCGIFDPTGDVARADTGHAD